MENIYFDRSQLKHCGKNVIIGKTVRIRHPEKVSIGDNVIIDDFCYMTGEIKIGDYVHIGNSCTVSASSNKISFSPFSTIAPGTKVFAATSNYLECGFDLPTIPKELTYNIINGDIEFGRFVIVGANCVITPNVKIPEGCTFSANLIIKASMVSNLKPWHVIFDNQGTCRPRKGVENFLEKVKQFYHFE